VLDFGLANLEEGSSAPREIVSATSPPSMTHTGQFVGSLPWASPEQVASAAGGMDVRSDVYSLGVVLYQMLTGEFPYDVRGNSHEVVQRILHTEPPRPSRVLQSSALRANRRRSFFLRPFVPSSLRAFPH
jgi:serine/threonine-protein kinase